MTFTEYLKRENLSLEKFGEKVGVSKGRLSQLNNDGTDWPPDLALKVEEQTGGEVNAADLSSIIARARQAAA
jgi:DNA-binding transcriptional regulator YdaS (Cro superfamily)